MPRCYRLLSVSIPILAAWIGGIRAGFSEPLHTAIIWVLPAMIFCVGLLLVLKLIHGVLSFPSCPAEEASLREEIKEALEDLVHHGLVDAKLLDQAGGTSPGRKAAYPSSLSKGLT